MAPFTMGVAKGVTEVTGSSINAYFYQRRNTGILNNTDCYVTNTVQQNTTLALMTRT